MAIMLSAVNPLSIVFAGNRLRSVCWIHLKERRIKVVRLCFFVRQKQGQLVVIPESACMKHNRLCLPLHYQLYPVVRRLTNEQTREVKMIASGTPSDRIRLMVRMEYGKLMLPSDVTNVRAQCTETAVPASNLLELH
jgi:hypothetical protein